MQTDPLVKSTGITNPLVLISAAIDKGISPDDLGKLLDLQERWEKNRAAETFAQAITAFQTKMPAIVKGNPVRNKHGEIMYHFADFADIMEVAQPILNECGIVITFSTEQAGTLMATTCHVRVGTHVEHATVTIPTPQIPNANGSQMAGGALSYGQRYSFKAALNIRIRGDDNDGRTEPTKITPDQIGTINDLLEECRKAGKEVNFPGFLAYLAVENLDELLAADFDKAVAALKQKKGQK